MEGHRCRGFPVGRCRYGTRWGERPWCETAKAAFPPYVPQMSDRRAGAVPVARNSGRELADPHRDSREQPEASRKEQSRPLHRSLYHRLHAMIARDKGWIDGARRRRRATLRLKAQPLAQRTAQAS